MSLMVVVLLVVSLLVVILDDLTMTPRYRREGASMPSEDSKPGN